MKKHPFILSALSFALPLTISLSAQAKCQLNGDWAGQISVPGSPLMVQIHFEPNKNTWVGDIDIPSQKTKDFALSEISSSDSKVNFKMAGVPGTPLFSGAFSKDCAQISGSFSQGGAKLKFQIKRPNAQEAAQEKAKTAALLKEIKVWIESQRKALKTPGLSVVIVKDDQVIFEEGFGLRSRLKKSPVTPDTLFAIGSTTKAFTATLLGSLVDQDKLSWKEPIKNKLPEFKLFDPQATKSMTLEDLLSHRSGLPRHDLAWYGSTQSREALFKNLEHLKPTLSFREGFQYQNLMYMSAGILAEKVTGKTWEALLTERVLNPLNMSNTTPYFAQLKRSSNYAQPYEKRDGKVQKIPFRPIEMIGPAGSLFSTAKDMGKWLKFNLGNGKVGKHTLLTAQTLKYLQSPQMVMQKQGSNKIPFVLYGMGWMIHPYRGEIIVQHGGNIDGFSAMVGMVPSKNIGIALLSNRSTDPLPNLAMFYSFEKLLGMKPSGFENKVDAIIKQRKTAVQKANQTLIQIKGTRSAHAMSEYAGIYRNPAYGDMKITEQFGTLNLNYRDTSSPLDHLHYETYTIQKSVLIKGLKLQFQTDMLGEIEYLSTSLQAGTSPIIFKKESAPFLKTPRYLKRFEGKYDLQGLQIKVFIKQGHLQILIPNQPAYALSPTSKNRFKIKKHPEFAVQFEEKGNDFELLLIQPNGISKASLIPSKP